MQFTCKILTDLAVIMLVSNGA